MNKVIVFLLTFLLASACNKSDQFTSSKSFGGMNESEYDEETYAEGASYDAVPRTMEPPEAKKVSKIIKTGNIAVEVDGIQDAKSKVDSLIKSLEGYYENESFYDYGNRLTYSLVIRVPEENFQRLTTVLEEGVGTLVSKNMQARDVSEEYTDLEIRLANKLAYLEQYREILKKAKSIRDILDIQEKIRVLEEEIESKKGRIKYLDDQVSYSTLSVEISELVSRKLGDQPRFLTKIINAGKAGFVSLQSFFIGLVSIWPYLIILTILMVFRRRIFRFIIPSRKK